MKNVLLIAGWFAAVSNLPAAQGLANEQDALEVLSGLHDQDALTWGIESDGADRIRLAQRLTMLTQKVASASCALTSDVAVDESYADLEEAMHETDIILDALKFGNEALHILGPEEDRRTLHDLQELRSEWLETHLAVEAVLADGHDVESAHIIDDHNLSLLEKASVIASDILGHYSHPYELSQADALLLKIAGRQKMLTQKMSKDACEIWTGYHADVGREDLEATMVVFENSLNALRFGLPELGIIAAPTPEIEADLDSILARWSVIRGNLDLLLAGEELDKAQKHEIFHDFNEELKEIDHLVYDYSDYVKRHH